MRSTVILFFVLHVLALGFFIRGFLLRRVRITEKNAEIPGLPSSPPFDRLVWVMVDALRYDFAVSDGRYSCSPDVFCHQGHMKFLNSLISKKDGVASFRFVADAPTTTTQRLTSLTTGCLPTFFDIGNSFNAPPITEDNIIDQFYASGKKLAFVGDATWAALFPEHLWSHSVVPLPCFNVMDLHSVDEGISARLEAIMFSNVSSERIVSESSQRLFKKKEGGASNVSLHLNSTGVLKSTEERNPNKDTPHDSSWDVLITHYLGVDHAGHAHGVSSPEMASKLVQIDGYIERIVKHVVSQDSWSKDSHRDNPKKRTLLLISGDHGQTLGGDHGGGGPEEVDSLLVAVDCSTLDLSSIKSGQDDQVNQSHPVYGDSGLPEMPQIDIVPSLSALLGVPIPFGSLGIVQPRLLELGQHYCDKGWSARILQGNAAQVHRYLNAYASAGSFSSSALSDVNESYQRGVDTADEALAFLKLAVDVARAQWTQFDPVSMGIGLILLILSFCLQTWKYISKADLSCHLNHVLTGRMPFCAEAPKKPQPLEGRERRNTDRHPWALLLSSVLVGCVVFCTLGIFSFFYLLKEGTLVTCALALATCSLLIGSRSGRGSRWKATTPSGGLSVRVSYEKEGLVALGCLATVLVLGVQHHSGHTMWQRLHGAAPHGVDVTDRSEEVPGFWFDLLRWPQSAHFSHNKENLTLSGMLYQCWIFLWNVVSCGILFAFVDSTFLSATPQGTGLQKLQSEPTQRTRSCDVSVTLLGKRRGSSETTVLFAFLFAILAWYKQIGMPGCDVFLPRCVYGLVVMHLSSCLCRGGGIHTGDILSSLLVILPLLSDSIWASTITACIVGAVASLCTLLRVTDIGSLGAGAVLVLLQSLSFFGSGHVCEFAGLRYTAAFVGVSEYNLWIGAVLMSLDTFGGQIAVHLAAHEFRFWKIEDVSSVLNMLRTGMCLVAMVSAAVQQRHLYAWALFAPRFVFETCFLLVEDLLTVWDIFG